MRTAKKLAKSSVEEYQAFAAAVKQGGGEREYDAHDVSAREPGGGGVAHDWGETSLDAMIEQIGAPSLRSRGIIHPELTAVEKYMAFNDAQLAKDRQLEEDLVAARAAIQDFLRTKPAGEAEVSPIDA